LPLHDGFLINNCETEQINREKLIGARIWRGPDTFWRVYAENNEGQQLSVTGTARTRKRTGMPGHVGLYIQLEAQRLQPLGAPPLNFPYLKDMRF